MDDIRVSFSEQEADLPKFIKTLETLKDKNELRVEKLKYADVDAASARLKKPVDVREMSMYVSVGLNHRRPTVCCAE